VLEQNAARIATVVDLVPDTKALIVGLRYAADNPNATWRLLGRALLDGWTMPQDHRSPRVDRMVAILRDAQSTGDVDPDDDPEALAALGLVCLLGWLHYGPYVARATGLADRDSDGLGEIAAILTRVLGPNLALGTPDAHADVHDPFRGAS
jgi:hypothetical protein